MTAASDRAVASHHERRAIKAEDAVAAVSALHHPEGRKQVCAECQTAYPCRTARLLGAS